MTCSWQIYLIKMMTILIAQLKRSQAQLHYPITTQRSFFTLLSKPLTSTFQVTPPSSRKVLSPFLSPKIEKKVRNNVLIEITRFSCRRRLLHRHRLEKTPNSKRCPLFSSKKKKRAPYCAKLRPRKSRREIWYVELHLV